MLGDMRQLGVIPGIKPIVTVSETRWLGVIPDMELLEV